MKIKLTRELAQAIAKDEANRRMKKAGRKAWSRGDYNLCVKTFNKLWPVHRDIYG
jgi:hypothetical protein